MYKIFLIVQLIILNTNINWSQQTKYFTRNGFISFLSESPLENIKAVNKQTSCIYDTQTNRIIAKVLIKAFTFKKALMQEHFNENYLESDKYPKASFKGKFVQQPDLSKINNSSEKVFFEGNLTIHGITKPLKSTALLSYKEEILYVKTNFLIKLEDFDIEIPSTVINNISKTIKVNVNFKLEKFK